MTDEKKQQPEQCPYVNERGERCWLEAGHAEIPDDPLHPELWTLPGAAKVALKCVVCEKMTRPALAAISHTIVPGEKLCPRLREPRDARSGVGKRDTTRNFADASRRSGDESGEKIQGRKGTKTMTDRCAKTIPPAEARKSALEMLHEREAARIQPAAFDMQAFYSSVRDASKLMCEAGLDDEPLLLNGDAALVHIAAQDAEIERLTTELATESTRHFAAKQEIGRLKNEITDAKALAYNTIWDRTTEGIEADQKDDLCEQLYLQSQRNKAVLDRATIEIERLTAAVARGMGWRRR